MLRNLFQKKNKNKEHSLKLIYELFYSHVYKIAFFITKDREYAQDVLQETFIKVFNHIEKVEDVEKMKAWISTITTRTAIDFIRKQKRGNEFELEYVNYMKTELLEFAFTVEEEVERTFLSKRIHEEIEALSPEHRAVLYLKYIEDYRDQEIASLLEVNISTVKTRIHRAKIQLKRKLEKKSILDGEI